MINYKKDLKLDLLENPYPSDTPPTRPASFFVVSDATASLSQDKTTITSLLALSGEGVGSWRKSSKNIEFNKQLKLVLINIQQGGV